MNFQVVFSNPTIIKYEVISNPRINKGNAWKFVRAIGVSKPYTRHGRKFMVGLQPTHASFTTHIYYIALHIVASLP